MSMPTSSVRGRFAALAQVIGGMLCLQFGSSYAKMLFPTFGATGMLGLRTFFAAIMLMVFFRSWHAISRRVLLLVLPYGLSLAGMNYFFYLALGRLPLGTTVALEFTGPLVLSFIQTRRWSDVVWTSLTLMGLVLLLRPESAISPDLLGILFALLAAAFWALYILFAHNLAGKLPSGQACSLGMLCGAVAVFVPCTAPALWTGLHTPTLLGLSVLVALCSSALPYALEMQAMQKLSAREFGVLCSLEPVSAALAGAMLLHEIPSFLHVCGILCVASASVGTVLTPQRTRPTPQEGPVLPD
ncbi:MAG: EamA family transporter [Acetobacter syzygii]|uniref:EamA family transporter n=1 Tax=Acetobacter syzygii TaxID=146476 RepID=UPI0005DAEE64|nr:EamA family transporter [Acetobacter syzygii]GAN70747.1 transporter EamA [Acetobacter syzygii]